MSTIKNQEPIIYDQVSDLADVINAAVTNGIVATTGDDLGEFGRVYLAPAGYVPHVLDTRDVSDPNPGTHIAAQFTFTDPESFARYVLRYATPDTIGYIHEIAAPNPASFVRNEPAHPPLCIPQCLASYVIDDHPTPVSDDPSPPAWRGHVAHLSIRPTAQAIRWGTALGTRHDQESMLDLVVDGIGEIAEPDGATLRDLVADLHAIRTTAARSVSRRSGDSTVEVSENVTLHAGPGNTVTIPERMTVTFRPFHTDDATTAIVLPITIRPTVNTSGQVMFTLSCPSLADELDRVIRGYASRLAELTGIDPLWIP
jgi:hypothetical protein